MYAVKYAVLVRENMSQWRLRRDGYAVESSEVTGMRDSKTK